MKRILLIETFYAGSHRQFIDQLYDFLKEDYDCHLTFLPAKKWHWSVRVGAMAINDQIPNEEFDFLFASASFNLAELLGIFPKLAKARKILYFHENQLIYPLKNEQERDFQLGYNQIISATAADEIFFNSDFNRSSFLGAISAFLNKCPIAIPRLFLNDLREKSATLPINIQRPKKVDKSAIIKNIEKRGSDPLRVVWPHRWEHDKNPDLLARVIMNISKKENLQFHVSILGESTNDIPKCLLDLFNDPSSQRHIENKGFQSRSDYWKILMNADVVISTAFHEFYGLSWLEAVSVGCVPLCPNRLVYPELICKSTNFGKGCLYNTDSQLEKTLIDWIMRPMRLRKTMVDYIEKDYHGIINSPDIFNEEVYREKYCKLFE